MKVAVADREASQPRGRFQILAEGDCRVWGQRVSDTLAKLLRNAGLEECSLEEASRDDRDLPVTMIRADYLLDRSAVQLLLAAKPTAIVTRTGASEVQPVAVHCARTDASLWRDLLLCEKVQSGSLPEATDIIDAADPPLVYDYELRKQSLPLIRRVTPESRMEIERTTFKLAYKGVTDLVTKYVYPWPAFHATRFAARLGLSPNAITSLSLLLVFVVLGLFAEGQLALGIGLGFVMSFLDTLDGKLARVTQNASRFGKHFDHLTDLIHPPFWWLAWWWGAAGSRLPVFWDEAAAIAFFGYIALRVQEWRFKRRFGVRIHVWQRFDSNFRLITSRRNPNLLLLSAALLIGEPELGLHFVAGWTVLSFTIHAVRWLQAEIETRRVGPLESWLETAGSDYRPPFR